MPTNKLADAPRYLLTDAAHYLKLPLATLRSWVYGRTYPTSQGQGTFSPLIVRPDPDDIRLSYFNLVEAFVLSSLRRKHLVPMREVRIALGYAETELGIKRPLLSNSLLASPGSMFLEYYGNLLNIGLAGQAAMKQLLEQHLERLRRDDNEMPTRFYPIIWQGRLDTPKLIVLNPSVSFGRPVIERHGISTAVISERFLAGEPPDALAADYDLATDEILYAIWYEQPRAA